MYACLFSIVEIKSQIKDWQGYLFKRLSGAKTFSADFLKKVSKSVTRKLKEAFFVGFSLEA